MDAGMYVHTYIGPLYTAADVQSSRISPIFHRRFEREREAMGKKKGRGGNGGNAGDQNGGKPIEEEPMNEGENKEPKKGGGGGGGGSMTIVLKVDMHCEGCSKKVKNSLKGTLGIEKVTSDIGSNKLTVIGEVDPIRIRDRVQSKTHKKVELLSPLPTKKNQDENKKEDKKPKEPPVSAAVLKISLHCEGCAQRIRKKIMRVKGVYSVAMDHEKDQVSVRGIMDVKTLPVILKEKLKRAVEIVQPKKEKYRERKGEEEGEGGDKKEYRERKGEEEGEGGDKKENGGGGKKDGGEGKKAECHYGEYGNSPYYMEMVHAPQLFSDENPNSCCVM